MSDVQYIHIEEVCIINSKETINILHTNLFWFGFLSWGDVGIALRHFLSSTTEIVNYFNAQNYIFKLYT